LNAIKVDAVSRRDAVESDPGTHAAAARIVTAVDHVYGVVGDLIRRLRPAGLDDLGLVAALESCVDQWRARVPNVRYCLAAEGDLEGLSELINLTLYRLIQEGLTNSARHAEAHEVTVSLRRESGLTDHVVLTVRDDGRGADLGKPISGFGLRGMRERVEMMGGGFAIESKPGRGFELRARLPAVGPE
jgi:two-component system sensor histidine kinase UhpB